MSISRAVRVALVVLLVCGLAALAGLVRPASAGSTDPAATTSRVAGTVSTRMVMTGFRAVGKKVVGRGKVVSTFRDPSGKTTVRRSNFQMAIREQSFRYHQDTMCHILFLEIGEVDLTLAGLHAVLRAVEPGQPIQLRLQARREGGILGKLFCDLTQGGGALATRRQAVTAAKKLNRNIRSAIIMRVRAVLYAPRQGAGAGDGMTSSPQRGLQAAECPVLHLILGPVHLDLLGLVVDLNKILLDLTAIPGTLLGNIFCQLVTPPPPPPAPAARS